MTSIGLSNKLDQHKDGFISHPEFNSNIDSIISLAPAIKDQFYNFLDVRSLGLVDLDTFLKVFKEFNSSEVVVKNDWDFENLVITEVSKWISKNLKLTENE